MIVGINKDEWYPIYTINEDCRDWFSEEKKIELTQEEFDKVNRVFAEFDDIQQLIREKLEKRDAKSS